MIVAQANGRVIGAANDLPWYLPADLKRFKELTTGHAVIMGRKTYDSILARIGKPLPNRTNIVITRDAALDASDVLVAHSPQDALTLAGDGEVFVIGGATIYEIMLPLAERIYLTQVKADIDGDAYFPELGAEWREVSRESHQSDERNEYDYDYVQLERAKK
jgi:dihydrofolate reductase